MRSREGEQQDSLHTDKGAIEAPAGAEPDYHGAMIRDAKLGPRRELTLCIETWPKGKPVLEGGDIVTLRFGAVANYEEIERFFANPPTDGLHYLRESSESRPNRRIVEMEFDRSDDRLRIIAGKVSVQAGTPI
ncbi:MAG TPA: hypothetical protein VMT39_00605 [Candidatus Bathyarchaeia archaeon]|nr:hypothetical protein [Candidatus Bathyarchaeia archaeon]